MRAWVMAVVTAVVIAISYGPYLWQFFVRQWELPHYQYFPFVLGAFVWLLWQRFSEAAPRADEHSGARRHAIYGSLAAAFFLLALATLINRPWLAYLSFIFLLTGYFLRVASRWQVCYLWGIWALLWLIRPLPLNRDQQLISFLQHLSSRLSSRLLDWIGVTHLMEGNTLLLAEKQFFVDEACSGIVSVMSIVACAVNRLSPPTNLLWDELQLAIRRRFHGAFSDRTFQIQVLTTATTALRDEQKQAARELLLGVRERLRQSIISGKGSVQE